MSYRTLEMKRLHVAPAPLTVRKFVYLRHMERSVSPAAAAFQRMILAG